MTLQARGIGKNFGDHEVLHGVDVDVQDGQIVFLYGPSGCGKTTLLRILGGLDPNHDGTVELNGQRIVGATPFIGLVSQRDLSFEWLSVRRNIAFGLRYTEAPKTLWGQISGRVSADLENEVATRMARLVGLSERDLDKYPGEISGGMKQRVSLARALVTEPEVILLDEPFSALDFEARQGLQDLVLRVREETGTSFICVSHDPEEVVYLADQVCILGGSPARVVQQLMPEHSGPRVQELKYGLDFQDQKRRLRETLNSSSYRTVP
jgi:ABC-type nitrate/sulfonate/bicarbonate transport system ATPase subunit